MKLITEEIETAKVLIEEKDGKKNMFIEGIFLQGNLKNRNGRFYPVETLEKEVSRYNESFVGKAQILNTPMGKIAQSLLDDGVTLGVSSRGMGSLKDTSEGYKVVGEDFMLATAADIVADPSAPDAFVNGIMEGVDWIWEAGILKAKQSAVQVVEEKTMTHPAIAVAEPEKVVEAAIEKTQKTINTLVDQGQLDEKKLEIFQNFLSNL